AVQPARTAVQNAKDAAIVGTCGRAGDFGKLGDIRADRKDTQPPRVLPLEVANVSLLLLLGAVLASGQTPSAVNWPTNLPTATVPPAAVADGPSATKGKDANRNAPKAPDADKGKGNGDDKDSNPQPYCFFTRLVKAYCEAFFPPQKEEKDDKDSNGADGKNGNGDGKNGDGKNGDAKDGNGDCKSKSDDKEPARRALPAPFPSPPFPTGEWQGFPLIGVPVSSTVYPLMKAIYGGPCGEEIKESRVKLYGWINGSYNRSTEHQSNTPSSYWID